ncbi:acyltransferase domain-containing protein [Mycobacterium bohemicum DSM 44277]|uniref:Acyltransferase domain-containing protein n=1 Tax=Mycobacterium bohemicum DSM 44277 TaxID=1236609 RepID=A0A0U0W6G0_MYCBE|nr:acyltransferase domain-containing protein [Mycobacterium bohemicum DSM 44277]
MQAAVTASADLKAVPSNLNPPLADAKERPLGSKGCLRDILLVDHPQCATGDTASSTTVALVGDSNAAMWEPAFEEVAAQRHWRLETLAKGYCPLLDLPIAIPLFGREYTECEQWRGQILARLQAEHPRLVVLSMMRRYGAEYGWASGFTSYDPAWIAGLTRQVQQLRRTGAAVLVLGAIPDPQSVVPLCLSLHLDDASACSPPTSKAVNRAGIAAESAATKADGGQYADLTELFCTADRCPVIVGNTLVYRDQDHVTFEYSRLLAPVVGALADRALAPG